MIPSLNRFEPLLDDVSLKLTLVVTVLVPLPLSVAAVTFPLTELPATFPIESRSM